MNLIKTTKQCRCRSARHRLEPHICLKNEVDAVTAESPCEKTTRQTVGNLVGFKEDESFKKTPRDGNGAVQT